MLDEKLEAVYADVVGRNPGEGEFHQAVSDVLTSIGPALTKHPELAERKIIERLCEPERQIIFRVPWVGRPGRVQINRGFRVEFNSRARPVQGRSAFPPVGLSRHRQVPWLRTDLQERADRHADRRRQGRRGLRPEGSLGRRGDALLPVLHDRAVPPHRRIHRRARRRHRRRRREIGYLFGQYKRITNRYESGVAHRQGPRAGAAPRCARRPPATVLSFFTQEMLQHPR